MSAARAYPRFWLPALAALAVLAFATTAHADYEQVGIFGESGNAEQLGKSAGAAINLSGAGGVEPGSVYFASPSRVSRYNPKGEIKEVWGWNTIASGPDQPDQVSSLTVKATSGSYKLVVETGSGVAEFTDGSKLLTGVSTEAGEFHIGDALSALNNVPAGATIAAVSGETIEMSAAANGSTGDIHRKFPFRAKETTNPLPYNATAAELKAALVALPAFESSDITVTGGPGDSEGTNPYVITFEGAYTGTPVELASTGSSLAGGVPSSSASVGTMVPASTPGFERCRPDNGDKCVSQVLATSSTEEDVGGFNELQGITVDQTTGYVYVINDISGNRQHNLIEVFSADGSESIARFGDARATGKTIEEEPGTIGTLIFNTRGLTVDETGKVYVGDSPGIESRAMCFRPIAPGDYQHYVYCGRSEDIKGIAYPQVFALDDAGHFYAAEEGFIEERSLADPEGPPLCTYNTHGQLTAMTVNPHSGEVFYFGRGNSDKSIHRLAPCNPAAGKFEESQAKIKVLPEAVDLEIFSLAINPDIVWSPDRSPGILYGANFAFLNVITPNYEGLGYVFAQAEIQSPTVLSASVSHTRTTSTLLQAEIDPHGFGTHYAFQYLPGAQYEANEAGNRFAGAAEAPVGGANLGGSAVGQVSASLAGLSPDTAYVFRVIATSECDEESGNPCVTSGEAVRFATYPSYPPGLPDHRAYELVSPAQKSGGEVIPAEPGVRSCMAECKPSSFGVIFPMQSAPDGESLAYEGQAFNSSEGPTNYDSYLARRTDSGWENTGLIPALPLDVKQVAFDASLQRGMLTPANASQLEIQDTSDPSSTTPLVTAAKYRPASGLRLSYGGHSADFSRQLFAANDSLTESTSFAPEPPDPGFSGKDLYEWHGGQLALVNVAPGNSAVVEGAAFASLSPDANVISKNGRRIYFEAAGQLYVREDAKVTREVTHPGGFLAASPDGLEVLLDDGCLYSLATESCTDLTEGHGGFRGVLGQSTDLSRIYFAAGAALTSGAQAGSCTRAPEGQGAIEEAEGKVPTGYGCNIYLYEAGSTARFIATVSAAESTGGVKNLNDWDPNPGARTAEASPNGRFLAFGSVVNLTGYDSVGHPEAFLYDSATGRLACASCNPTGEAPRGIATLRRIEEGSVPGLPQPRYLTDEGRLYFDSGDSLVARDTNNGVEDVYQYEPEGAGTCSRVAGCVNLISAGTEPVDSNLIAVDESGRNVFFDTRDRLSLKDKDELLDVYDAREGGGIAAESEIARAECQGEACQPPVGAPNDPTPSSTAFVGPGNVKEPQAKKHKKRHHKKHKRHARKHDNQKSHAKKRAAQRNHGGAK